MFLEGPSTQYLRTLVPNTIKSMVFGTRDLKYWVFGPSGVSVNVVFGRLRCISSSPGTFGKVDL